MKVPFFALVMAVLWGCNGKPEPTPVLFSDVTNEAGITFSNNLTFTEQFNPYTYRNFYNGAGVAVGDINNDGLNDIYFAGNQVSNKLYLNQGNFKFKDITDSAGVACKGVWSSGVTFVDINADGLLDIYICKSGSPDAPNRYNELFINNGDLTFTEKAKDYGLDVTGLSVQATFFDYDKDGDLDCYLLTNSIRNVGNYDLVKDQRNIPDPQGGGNKFLINENGKFRDYSAEAGIYRSNIGFGLGITLGDFNQDTWPDIFVSNDFFERDYLYINNQDGTFTESLTNYFMSISMGSMGADYADLDNDGSPELFVTEMLPDSLHRRKTKTVYENWDKYQFNILNGYYHQQPRNVLQTRTGKTTFAEIGRMAGVAASEWSWGALLFDMDNDGLRDIFVANGIYKDLLDRDYLTYTAAEENIRKMIREEKDVIMKLINQMPSSKFPNYAFHNQGDFKFENVASHWGFATPMYSCGSAYGDFDNDGDIDLVVNNIQGPSILYRNNTDTAIYKSITLGLFAGGGNTQALGAEVKVYGGSKLWFADNFVSRGFQSAVQSLIQIGVGDQIQKADSVIIKWPDYGYTVLYDVPGNKKITVIKEKSAVRNNYPWSKSDQSLLTEIKGEAVFQHKASGLVDFNRDRLIPFMYSNETPSLTLGDIDGDGLEEVYVGGGKDQPGGFISFKSGKPILIIPETFTKYSLCEETQGALFDADNDGDLDFYMACGGRFYSKTSDALKDHLFINDGKGNFAESTVNLPYTEYFSTAFAEPLDYDQDGDTDLLTGERFHPYTYGKGGRGYLLQNDGKGKFTDVTETVIPSLKESGMLTDATSVDVDGDGENEIIIVGDWLPIMVFKETKGKFENVTDKLGFKGTEGWWNKIEAGDLNKDGKTDLVFGNYGLNSFFKSGDRMYLHDFDDNGSPEQVFCTLDDGKYYPTADKDALISQIPVLKKSLLYYRDYGRKTIEDLFPKVVLNQAKIFQVNQLASIMWISGTKGYKEMVLPLEAQYAPIYALSITDIDQDGVSDLVVGGNHFNVKPQYGREDGSKGWWFKGILQNGNFSLDRGVSLEIDGEIRGVEHLKIGNSTFFLFAKHNDELEIYKRD